MASKLRIVYLGVVLAVLTSLLGGCGSVMRMTTNMDVMAQNTGIMAANTTHIAGSTASANMKTGKMIELLQEIKSELAQIKERL